MTDTPTDYRPALIVLNPRRMALSIDSIEALPVDRIYLTGYTETELSAVFERIAQSIRWTHLMVISDDCIVTPAAFHAVNQQQANSPQGVFTGWCNLDQREHRVNLTQTPFKHPEESFGDDYNFYTWTEVLQHPGPVLPSWFAGMCLTSMPIEYWRKYPFQVYKPELGGYGSDHKLAVRLQADDIPIWGVKDAFVLHLKEQWNRRDQAPGAQLRLGGPDKGVRVFPADVEMQLGFMYAASVDNALTPGRHVS